MFDSLNSDFFLYLNNSRILKFSDNVVVNNQLCEGKRENGINNECGTDTRLNERPGTDKDQTERFDREIR